MSKGRNVGCDVNDLGVLTLQILRDIGCVTKAQKPAKSIPFCVVVQVWHSILSQKIDFEAEELQSVSVAARNLLEGLLERDPADRLTPKQALVHPWIKVRTLAPSPSSRQESTLESLL